MPELAYLDASPSAALRIEAPSGGQASANFTMVDTAGAYRPVVGDPVQLYSGATRIFGGYIVEVVEFWDPCTSIMRNAVSCADYSIILDRRLFSGAFTYANTGTLLAILNLIYDEILVDEILDFGTVSTAVVMAATDRFEFNTATLREVFNQLAEFFEVDWHVDFYGVISFSSGTAAPFNLADNNGNFLMEPVPLLTRSVGNYANRIAVKSSQSLTSLRSETYIVGVGDGFHSGQRDIHTEHKVTDWPTSVTVDNLFWVTEQPIGRTNPDTGTVDDRAGNPTNNWRWRWIPDGRHLIAHPGWETLPDGYIVRITYPSAPITAAAGNFVEDAAQIAARAAIEGSSGKYDRAEDISGVSSPTTVANYADGLLAKLAVMPIDFQFHTDRLGLAAGQTISVNLSRPLINSSFWIESVSGVDIDGEVLRWSVKATTGRVRRTNDRARFFSKLIEQTKQPPSKAQHITVWRNALTALVTGTNVGGAQFIQRAGYGAYVEIWCDDPPVGSAVIVDVKMNGVSCLQAPVSFLPGVVKSVTYAFSTYPNPLYFEQGAKITYDITQVGVTTPGGRLWVKLVIHG